MDPLTELLGAGHVVLDVQAPDFDACLSQLSAQLGEARSLGGDLCGLLTEALRDRERLSATAVGRGVAIPHAYVDGIPRVMLLFARLAEPLEYAAPDNVPVDLVVLLVGPAEAQTGHLPLLARITRLLHDQRLLDELRTAASAEDVRRALREVEARHA